MEPDDSSPSEPRMELDKSKPTLTREELEEIEAVLEDAKPVENQLTARLYNDYLRQLEVISKLADCLGPAAEEIMEDVYKEVG